MMKNKNNHLNTVSTPSNYLMNQNKNLKNQF